MFFVSLHVYADNEHVALWKGDSLFAAAKYNQALRKYKQVYFIKKKYSTSMLLKMAQISERNGHYADALFYLQTLYVHHPSRKLSQYMAQLASMHEMGGFNFSDFELIAIYMRHYQDKITLALILSGLVLLAYMAYLRFTKKRLIYYPVLFVLFCLTSGVLLNLGEYYSKGIVANNNVVLFEGPSPASHIVGVIDKGNRVTVLSQQDVWYHISFEDKDAYINGKNLLLPL